MLKIENFSYRYQTRNEFTLKNINLELRAGEMVLLAGPSGCGKSTLIKAISGLNNDGQIGERQGKIFLEDVEITTLSPEKIGVLVGTVYQTPDDQLFAMTAADEVRFALDNQGYEESYVYSEVEKILELVGLKGMGEYSIHKLSGGQRQRLALAAVLITKPKLLILDEPVSQMNPQGVVDFLELLTKLNKKENIAILMVEHRVNELYTYFNRLCVMVEGSIIYDGLMEETWQQVRGDLGLREPEGVKLSRALYLKNLSSDTQEVVKNIQEEYEISCISDQNKKINQGKALVNVENLSYTYPLAEVPTLFNLNFSIGEGEVLALMGFNGAGKSTLLNLLGGLLDVEIGSIRLEKKNISSALEEIGYLRQEADLMLLADTVREELAWKNKHLTAQELKKFLELLHLEEYVEDFPLALSKGQRLRVVLGSMLAKRPRLLLLDEPTTGQDEASLQDIKFLIREYKKNGGSVFICTHDVELASEISDRVLLLEKGRVLAVGTAKEIVSNKALMEKCGLVPSKLLEISKGLGIGPCINIEEVKKFVSPSTLGRN